MIELLSTTMKQPLSPFSPFSPFSPLSLHTQVGHRDIKLENIV